MSLTHNKEEGLSPLSCCAGGKDGPIIKMFEAAKVNATLS